jgi:hypothetical protein
MNDQDLKQRQQCDVITTGNYDPNSYPMLLLGA